MTNYTKRFMECFILLTVLVAVMVHCLEWRREKQLRADAKGLPAVLNQDIYNRIGPGETTAYLRFFDKYQQKMPSLIQITELLTDREGLLQGLAAVKEAPEPVKAVLQDLDPLQGDLENLLKKGPFVLSKNEKGFDSAESVPSIPGDLGTVLLWIRLLAVEKWLQGSPDEAVALLTNVLRLGSSFQKTIRFQEPQLEIWKNGLAGINLFTWNDPSPEKNRLIARYLSGIDESTWTFDGNRVRYLMYYLQRAVEERRPLNDELTAAGSILSAAYDQCRTEIFVKSGMIPSEKTSHGRLQRLLMKWTTLPAMRKRAERIPDSFFESDPLLSAETIKKFPRLVYLSLRYMDERFYSQQMERWYGEARNRAKALKAAYAARIWRDEHGTWPNAEQFSAFCPQSAPFEWHITSATEPLVKHFMSIHGIDEKYLLPDEWNKSYHIGYLEMLKIDYFRIMGSYGYLSGMPIDPLFDEYDRINEDESLNETTRALRNGLLDAKRRRFHGEIKGATVTASVLLPHPPKEFPARMAGAFWPGSYELKDIRKPPECDATVVCPIPEKRMTDRPPELIGDATEPQRIKMNWASGILKAFRPLVVSVTEVCPPPQLSDQAKYTGDNIFTLCALKDIKSRMAPSLPGEPKWEDVQDWHDPAQGQPAVIVGLKFPKRSFWVTHPGPDGVSDGPGLIYDPSNGIKSRGDIVQLAGMEY